ncbi:Lrp/AsnC family transcriptional regulator [Paenirhodobacter hankyongi]|uniref:Lrp/AsnC family transcriptional regulator n=1 Tax=Paenirhodobacter hankyongi TaxID=2294033 RepID=A0A421BNX2_9RHOB|nr:Lrp/AsnC family transcriptional regulator [Sinirhodobacter hankyongi]RLL64769.1 Lrp/AsnC family transcriptional regulator [Sinirhodobacter hankyongi]
MDAIDRRILRELQINAALPIAELADRVGLSQSPCWRRVHKLEEAGVIAGRTIRVAPEALGLGLTVYVEVIALDHTPAWRAAFLAALEPIPEVMEVLRLGGAADYLLRVVTADMASYDALYRRLTEAVPMRAVSSRFVMERLLSRPSLPPQPS